MNQLLPQSRKAVLGCCVALTLLTSLGWAQVRGIPVPIRGFARPAMMPAVGPVSPQSDDDPENKFSDGPGLKTDPEAQQLLSRAEQFTKDERFDLAAVLWQKVLDDSADSLVSVDGRLYISLRRQVEQRLATLPKLALQTYRVTADGEAQAVLSAAGPEKEEDALAEVVRRFFMSSVGDDAAYKLGCIALDRYDFIGASRLFAKVLEEHPDPSMPRSELLIRLAVAAGRVGDQEGAAKYLADLDKAEGPRPSRTLVSLVANDIAQGATNSQVASARSSMPSIPAEATAKTLTELWSHEYPMLFQEQALNPMMYSAYAGPGRKLEKTQISREQLIERWKQNGWRPAGKLIIADGRVYFKTNNDLTSWSTSGDDEPIWRSAWLNDFEVDDYSQQLAIMAINMGQPPGSAQEQRPRSPAEILLFGDQIQQDMSLTGDMIYSIEGRRMPRHGPADTVARQPKPFNWNATPRRTRMNWLAAYDARTGKAKWHRAADDEAKEGTDGSMGFMSAPVACGNVLLAPMTDGGAMWLFGLSPVDGRTLWKTYLCDEPVGGCEAWSPMEVAVEGRDAYVLCGAGVVFAMDGTSGAIRWVVRYDRNEKPMASRAVRNPYGAAGRIKDFDGWSQDTLVPFGRQLVVMASDSNALFALDCRTGEFLWNSPRKKLTGEEVNYCIGLQGRGLFVAGKTQVRRIDVVSGKIIWEADFDSSFGRGVLTDEALYVPVKDSVLKLDLEKGTELGQVGVRLTSNDPVGNLFSDGEKLWVLSANRMYSLTHLDYRMKVLEQRIEEGDSAALLDRMRLLAKSEQWDDAMSDLGRAYRLISQHKDRDAAATDVLVVLEDLKLSLHRPAMVLTTLTELFADELPHFQAETRSKLDAALSASLTALRQEKSSNVVGSVLAVAPLLHQESLVKNAARIVKSAAQREDKELLKAAVITGKKPASLIAAEAWAIVDPEGASPVLKPWLGSGDDKVKLLAARALLQTGDPTALESLIALLGSGDLQIRSRSYQSLVAATGKKDLPFTAYALDSERAKQMNGWKDWYSANGDSAKLTLPLPEADTQLGRTLVCSHSRNQVVELDATGKEISRRNIATAWSAVGLPNGNRLVAVTSQGRLVEYDDQWKETWVVDGLPGGLWSVDRALDGNTLVASADAFQVLEIKPDKEKKVLWRGDGSGRPVFVKRLENGNTLICLQSQNKVIEVDAEGKQVWEASNLVNPFTAQRLENGNTLVAAMGTGGNGLIVEIDRAGRQTKVVKQALRQLYGAEQLAGGRLLYADGTGLHEVDSEGKSVWSRREAGITGFSRF